jgi:hypothetical protein
MVRFIIPKNKKQVSDNKKFSVIGKSSGVIPLASNPGIGTWYSWLCGEGCCPSCRIAWGGDGWRVFFFLFPAILGLMGHLL